MEQNLKCMEIGYTKHIRKDAECFGCLTTIKKDESAYYVKMASKTKIERSRMCPKCAFFMSTKHKNTGNGAVKRGQFQEHRLASPLKAAWKEALKRINEGKPVMDMDENLKALPPRPIRIITTAEEYTRIYNGKKFLAFPVRHSRRRFEVGGAIHLSSGISKTYIYLKILKVVIWSRATCKKMYGISRKHYLVTVEKE